MHESLQAADGSESRCSLIRLPVIPILYCAILRRARKERLLECPQWRLSKETRTELDAYGISWTSMLRVAVPGTSVRVVHERMDCATTNQIDAATLQDTFGRRDASKLRWHNYLVYIALYMTWVLYYDCTLCQFVGHIGTEKSTLCLRRRYSPASTVLGRVVDDG